MFGLFNKKKGKPGLLGVSLIDKELALAHIVTEVGSVHCLPLLRDRSIPFPIP